jgi:hypothetical protein
MAPAIAHFLIGASLLLFVSAVVVLRDEGPIEHLLWVLPIGGVWGILPDFHHIAPGYNEALYAFHGTPWVEVFALHYTLDRPAIRVLYHESIFASIAVFTSATAVFWIAARYRTATLSAEVPRERVLIVCVATLFAAGVATVVFGVVLSIQNLLAAVASLFGLAGVFTGWIIVGVWGVGAAWLWSVLIEIALVESHVTDPVYGAGVGCLGGVLAWLGSAIFIPILSAQSGLVIHWGSLLGLLTYGTVFGGVYATVRGTFSDS